MRRGSARVGALLAAGSALALAAGCGSAHKPTPVGLALQREDLVLAARTLTAAEPAVEREAAAARAAWPLIVNGLPPAADAESRARIEEATARARALPLPGLFGEETARSLTGGASGLAGTYQSFYKLATRSWPQIEYALAQLAQGPSAASRFAASNVALYIEAVYDAQFDLAQLGTKLQDTYTRLGGPGAFAATLPEAEVERLAAVYSEANFRLEPHVGVRLGS